MDANSLIQSCLKREKMENKEQDCIIANQGSQNKKGSSFDGLNQEQVLRMVNHINNTTRPKLHGSTPMKKALKSFDKNAMEKLGLEIIPPDEICLKPELLK